MLISPRKNLIKIFFLFLILNQINSGKAVIISINGKNYKINSPNVIEEDTEITDGTFESYSLEEPVFIIKGHNTFLRLKDNVIVRKNIYTSDLELDPEKQKLGFYSAILVIGSSTVELNKVKIETDCKGCIGVTVLENAKLYSFNSEITTYDDNSPGIYSNYGGKLVFDTNLINTNKNFSPCILLLGKGNINISDSQFTTKGINSELFYTEGNALVADSLGKSQQSNIITTKLIGSENIFNLQYSRFEGLRGVVIYSNKNYKGGFNSLESDLTLNTKNSENAMFEIVDSTVKIQLSNSKLTAKNGFLIYAKSSGNLKRGADVTVNGDQLSVSGLVKADNNCNIEFKSEGKVSFDGIIVDGDGKVEI